MENEYKIYQGDCLAVMKSMENGSVSCVVTSPPYYGLRDYGVEGQLGLEETLQEYVERTVEIFREVRRVLREDGTLWLNLGDSYNGSGGAGGDYNKGGLREGQPRYPGRNEMGLKRKDLMGVPWRVAFALQADGWWLRQDIIWSKPNVIPESVTDRCTKAHEYVFLLSKSEKYFFNQKAIQEKSKKMKFTGKISGTYAKDSGRNDSGPHYSGGYATKEFRNKRSVWEINTKPYHGAHFAVMPPELARLCVMAGSREGDIVFDPFCGSGTTGAVALGLERKFLGIELNAEYIALVEKRIGAVFERMQNKLDLNWEDEDESN